jgi:hypothetical protein
MFTALNQLFFPPKLQRSHLAFWLVLSLICACLYSMPALMQALSSEFVVQDDARQHVFWLWRFVDPNLFPQDFVADYFQSVAPWGYTTLYKLFAAIAIDPLLLHKLLPSAIMLLTTLYGFGVVLQILPIPMAGFLSTLLLNQAVWMKDDVVSATPVAFLYPIFLAFLYYLLRRALLPCLVAIALQGLFYPQCIFIYSAVLLLQLIRWQDGKLHLSRVRQDYLFSGAGLATAIVVLLPYALKSSEFGPTITAAQIQTLPTFRSEGWSHFFHSTVRGFWLCGKRSGMFPPEWCRVSYGVTSADGVLQPPFIRSADFLVPQIWFALLLPILLKFRRTFPLSNWVNPRVFVLVQVLLASLFFFFVAHLFIFKLHLPNRYTEHSFRIVFSLAAGMGLTIALHKLWQIVSRWGKPRFRWRSPVALLLILFFSSLMLIYPQYARFSNLPFPNTQYVTPGSLKLYQFLSHKPKESLIASIAEESNNIPSFARRSLYVGNEGFTLPYHTGYYQECLRRLKALITAQYSPDLAVVKQFIQQSGVTFWLVDRAAFKPGYFEQNPTLIEFKPIAAPFKIQIEAGAQPALEQLMKACSPFRDRRFFLVDTQCILK